MLYEVITRFAEETRLHRYHLPVVLPSERHPEFFLRGERIRNIDAVHARRGGFRDGGQRP